MQLPTLWPLADQAILQEQRQGITRERMLRELAEAVEIVAADSPLVLILEDLHWSDAATLDWLSFMARRREPARLLVIGTYRPLNALMAGHALRSVVLELHRHGLCQELSLSYWSASGVAEYLRQRFAGKPCAGELIALLHQRTDGNPLFLVAVTDDLLRRGVLHAGGNTIELVGGVEAVATGVPENLRHLIEQQLEQLVPADQDLLATASVAGMIFSAAAVAAGLESSIVEVEDRCAALARHQQFVETRGVAAWPDGTLSSQYGFRHALFHEVLYGAVPVTRLVQLHRRIGLCLETSHGSETPAIAAELAMHFIRGREPQRAVQYLRQAAQKALDRFAHREAVHYYDRALLALQSFGPPHDTRLQALDLHLECRNALVPLGEFDRILQHLREAEGLAQELGDLHRRGRIKAYLTRDLHMIGQHTEAVVAGEAALALVQAELPLRVATHLYLSYAYYALGEYRRAVEVLRPEVATLSGPRAHEHFGLAALPAVSTRVSLVRNLAELGEFSEGEALAIEALKIAEAAGQPFSLTQVYRGLGDLYLQRGQSDQAIPLLERGLALCQEADLPLALPPVASSLGTAYIEVGRTGEGLPLLEQAVALAASLQLGDRQALRLVLLAKGYLRASRRDEAQILAAQALALARDRHERGMEAYALQLLGALAANGMEADEVQAEGYYQQATKLADELGMRPLLAHSALGLATLHRHRGQVTKAHAVLSTAVALFDSMQMTPWRSRAQIILTTLT